ncbi:hypothetical protein CRG98_040356 [Punica granatum]|uniref:Uncharacterized protein n=1 Tax=Punica granatum TaxID=22663 RepID=A0A2I0I6J8_PUNGR|nr:hypothetical protein CRG98_040356 [Punica granatum]
MEKVEIAGGSSSPSSVLPGNRSTLAAALYDAATVGSVAALDDLLKQYGKVILHRVSLTSFAESPLHLAALMGHLNFSKRLLELRSELATEQDSEKCTPLHLAAANGHDQIVKELLKANGKACLIQDQEGRVPLHLAAMRGQIPVVRELLKSKLAQESVKKKIMEYRGDWMNDTKGSLMMVSSIIATCTFQAAIAPPVMSGTVTSLGLTFFKAMWLVVPDHVIEKYNWSKDKLYWVWKVTACIVGLFLLLRMCSWLKRFVHKVAWRRLLRLGPNGRASKPEPLDENPGSAL